MKKIIILLLSFVSFLVFAFDPPVDILSLDYQTFSKGKIPSLRKDELVFTGSTKYFGAQISYSVLFKKNDPTERYIFFDKPFGLDDVFHEFYKDYLNFYKEKAVIILTSLDYRDVIEDMYLFLIPFSRSVIIYRKISKESGWYGFGIAFGEQYDSIDEEVVYKQDVLRNRYLSKERLNGDIFAENTIFLGALPARNIVKETVLLKNKNSLYFEKKYLLSKEFSNKYKIIVTPDNPDRLEYLLIFSSAGDIFPLRGGEEKYFSASWWDDYCVVNISGKLKENTDSCNLQVFIKNERE